MVVRIIVLAFFLTWRIRNPNYDALWLWGISIVCEIWFAFSWLLDILPKLNPINRTVDLTALHDKFDQPSASNPTGRSDLPGIDVFVSTADAESHLLLLPTPFFPFLVWSTLLKKSHAIFQMMVVPYLHLKPWLKLSNLLRSVYNLKKGTYVKKMQQSLASLKSILGS